MLSESPFAAKSGRARPIRRSCRVKVEFPKQPGEGESGVAFDADCRMRFQPAGYGLSCPSVSVENFAGLLATIKGFTGQCQQPDMEFFQRIVAADNYPPPCSVCGPMGGCFLGFR